MRDVYAKEMQTGREKMIDLSRPSKPQESATISLDAPAELSYLVHYLTPDKNRTSSI